MMQQLARKATLVQYISNQHGLTDPHTNPSPAAIDIASSISFDWATAVEVGNASDLQPPANTPSPHPAIITHLQPFPKASELSIRSEMGGAAGRLLADKMPIKLDRVDIQEALGGEEKCRCLTE
ncbi:unnamed protein product [Vitrella brassicaformis CCMP3155]|uniref:Uncharacterized protein n=1 Tax=Vitrella brassicaformis (strain CCMP3155) TaxID=1169540 RepID=A0A0G4GGG0_VITBC|nr:unnamed protein product [Vitrella brassicaformis CCMP3155]|eukprot:CEM28703.1 unnamed protein product [Vitrella brassicaformis CCMP3155]